MGTGLTKPSRKKHLQEISSQALVDETVLNVKEGEQMHKISETTCTEKSLAGGLREIEHYIKSMPRSAQTYGLSSGDRSESSILQEHNLRVYRH